MHTCSAKSIWLEVSPTKLISQSTEFWLHGDHSAVIHPQGCVYLSVSDSPSWWVCVYVQEANEVSHDETDIDMLTRAKKSCEKYLISTLRQLLCMWVCECAGVYVID